MDVLWKENNVFYNVLCVLITENEKLFDRSDARLYWKTVYHMFAILHHGYAVQIGYGINMDSDFVEIQRLKKYRVAYLTGWNFSFQTVFLCLAFVHDVLQWFDKHEGRLARKIKYYRDVIFNGLVFPFTCFVTGMFWSVYLIDRELVFPQVYDQIVPWWLNHCVHTNIFVVIAIETLLTTRRHPTDVKVERILVGFVSVFYAVVYYSIYFFGGCWLYGVFGVMTWWQVCLYQTGIWFMTAVFYNMAFVINRLIHRDETDDTDSKTNGDIESKETTFSKNGSDFKTVENDKSDNATKDHNGYNGESVNGKTNEDGYNEGLNGKTNENGHNGESLNGKTKENAHNGETVNGKRHENGHNGETVYGKTNEGYLPSDDGDNEKDWKSIGNGDGDDNGSLNHPSFDKSWSTKYRTNRSQLENSSL